MARHDYTAPLEGTEHIVVTDDGARLRTVVSGSGDKTVLLAHGYAGAAVQWSLIASRLTAEGLRVISFDQRGHSGSSIGSNGTGSSAMASDYGTILEHHDATDVTLVGHSMGGFLSIAFLLSDAAAVARISSLLLMGTFAGDVSRNNPQNKLQIPLIKSGVLQKMLGFGPVATAFTKSLIGDDFEPEMVDAFVPVFLDTDHANLIPILQAMVNENRYDRLGEIAMPCTVVVGSKDKTTPPFHTADLHAGIAGSTLLTLPGVGHGLQWESPDEIAAEIVKLARS